MFEEGSKVLTANDKHSEFTMGMLTLIKEMQSVDEHFAIMPIYEKEGSKMLMEPNNIPLNHTKFGTHISFPPNASFEKDRPWGKNKEDLEEDCYINQEVNFSFVLSCDKNPEDVLAWIRNEWRKYGGIRLQVMTLKTHNPKGSIVLYHMHNVGHEATIIEEGRKMLKKARNMESNDTMDEFKWKSQDIPDFLLVSKMPNIPEHDTKRLDKLSWQVKNQRKALHITSDARHAKQLQNLMWWLRTGIWWNQCRENRLVPAILL